MVFSCFACFFYCATRPTEEGSMINVHSMYSDLKRSLTDNAGHQNCNYPRLVEEMFGIHFWAGLYTL